MKTLLLEKPEHLTLTETQEPTSPKPGEALVRVRRVGICGTDLHAYKGRQPFFSYPRILGHELGVEVVEVGKNTQNVQVGDYCAVEPYLNCGNCIACRNGKTNCCGALQVLGVHTDGGMRDYITVPAHKLHRSKTLSLEQLALVETLGIGAHAVSRSQVSQNENVLVLGAGPIGLSLIPFLQTSGVTNIIVRDINPNRLQFCQEQFNIQHTLASPDAETTINALQQITNNDMPTLVFDATGNVNSMQETFRYVAPGGKIVFVGLVLDNITFYDPDFHRREMTLFATRNSTSQDFCNIIQLMETKQINTTPWITHHLSAEELPMMFPQLLNPDNKVLKAIVGF